jgi:hypothetical protein
VTEIKDNPRARVAILVLLAVAVAAIAFLLLNDGDNGDDSSDGPRLVSADELRGIAADLGHPIYWVGERPGTRLEYERTDDGQIRLRYLSGDTEPGDTSQQFLAVGTYAVPDALGVLQRQAQESGVVRGNLAGGGIAIVTPRTATSAYVAYPGTDRQAEVYHPDPKVAIGLATSGRVVPVG